VKSQYLIIVLLILPLITENTLYAEARCTVTDVPCELPIHPVILDSFGHQINGSVSAGQQIQVVGYLTNYHYTNETFVYLLQIQDVNGVTLSLSWITGNLDPYQPLTPAQSWTPTASGIYTAQIFVWRSLADPNAFQPPEFRSIYVCDTGLIAVMKNHENTPTCVKPETAQKLIEHGLADYYYYV
jgi:hypothetical protein